MSEWWRVLGLEAPTLDPQAVYDAYLAKQPDVSVIYGGDEEKSEELEAALEEGIRYCQDAMAGVVRG